MRDEFKILWFFTSLLGGYVFLGRIASAKVTMPRPHKREQQRKKPPTSGECTPIDHSEIPPNLLFWMVMGHKSLTKTEKAMDEYEVAYLIDRFERDYARGRYAS